MPAKYDKNNALGSWVARQKVLLTRESAGDSRAISVDRVQRFLRQLGLDAHSHGKTKL